MTNRRDMVAEMIHELEGQFPQNRLQLRFECQVTRLHQNGTVDVQDCRDDTVQNIDYSLCVAADGSSSCIRKNLVEMGEIKATRFANSLSWKALQLPQQPSMLPGGFASYQSEDGKELCFVTPRYKDRFVMMYYRFNRRDPRAQANPMNVTNSGNLKSAVTTMFPNITNFPSETAMESFLEKRPGQEVYMTLNKHAIPDLKVALIGDAAVGTYVLFGHGCVSAMERATLLAESLSTNTNTITNLEEALETFSTRSVKEGRAISDLNLISHLLRNKLFRKKALTTRGQIQNLLVNEPDTSYHDILQVPGIKWTIRLSKLFWIFGRRKAPP
jgi:2-polyprenyl-6-methoxyphenol hydroxylase-like FAD-dependent oxidoreductase